MKGILSSPFYLQSTILAVGGFYLLALSTSFGAGAFKNCSYDANGKDELTNNQYNDLCVGNAISSTIFGLTSVLTLMGAIAVRINLFVYTAFYELNVHLLYAFSSGYDANGYRHCALRGFLRCFGGIYFRLIH